MWDQMNYILQEASFMFSTGQEKHLNHHDPDSHDI